MLLSFVVRRRGFQYSACLGGIQRISLDEGAWNPRNDPAAEVLKKVFGSFTTFNIIAEDIMKTSKYIGD